VVYFVVEWYVNIIDDDVVACLCNFCAMSVTHSILFDIAGTSLKLQLFTLVSVSHLDDADAACYDW
jgi:hypothetical protein